MLIKPMLLKNQTRLIAKKRKYLIALKKITSRLYIIVVI